MAEIKRLFYFNSQFLVDKDFNDEQFYHVNMRRRLNRALNTWGVAEGLDVTQTGPKEVTVTPGLAIDRDGQEIIVPADPAPGVVSLATFAANADVYLTIKYQQVNDPADHYTAGGLDKYTRITERPLIDTSTVAPPTDGSVILLAKIHLGAAATITGVDTSVRTRASSAISPDAELRTRSLMLSGGNWDIGSTEGDLRIGNQTTRFKVGIATGGGGAGDVRARAQGGTNRLSLGSGTNDVLTILGTNVGIGAWNPQSRLQVGALTAINEGGTAGGAWANIGSNSYFDGAWKRIDTTKPGVNFQMNADGAGQEFRFYRDNMGTQAAVASIGTATSFIAGGNFGVGTGAPTSPLDVRGNVKIGGGAILFADSAGTQYPDGWIGMTNNVEGVTKWLHVGGITDAGVRRIGLFANRIYAAGNLGLGITAPDSQLHLSGGAWDITNTEGDLKIGNAATRFKIGVATAGGGAGDVRVRAHGGTNRLMLGSGTNDVLTVLGNSVGIGNPNPQPRLQIGALTALSEGAGGNGAWANIGSNSYFDGAWKRIDGSKPGVNFHMNADGAGQEFRFYRDDGSSAGNIAIIGTTTSFIARGNFGINTTGPNAPLHILGGNWDPTNSEGDFKIGNDAVRLKIGVATGGGGAGDVRIRAHGGTNRLMLGSGTTDTVIIAGANVGIGTAAMQRQLHVVGNEIHSAGAGGGYSFMSRNVADFSANAGDRWVIYADQGIARLWASAVGDRMSMTSAGDMTVVGRLGVNGQSPVPRTAGWGGGIHTWDLEVEGSAWCRNGWQTGARDLAENYFSAHDLSAGDVICIDTETDSEQDSILLSSEPNSQFVMGVVSTQPGVLLNSDPDRGNMRDGKLAYPIALSGRVPCKVTDENGPIRRGDLLTSSGTPGHAMKALPVIIQGESFYRPGTIIGKALEGHDEGRGMIEVFIALR